MSLSPRHAVRSALGAVLTLAIAVPAAAQGLARAYGLVVDEDRKPLEGVVITATNPRALPPEFQVQTDDDGRYAMLGLRSGRWMFRAECVDACAELNGWPRGYLPGEGPSQIRQADNEPVSFILERIRHPLAQLLGEEAVVGVDLDAIEADTEAANAAYNAGNYEEAVTGYRSLLERVPQLTTLYTSLGNAYSVLKRNQEALEAYEQALANDPENRDLLLALARQKLALGTADEADMELLDIATTGLGATREDLYNQGELAFDEGNVAAAAEWYEKANAVDPNWGKPLYKLALVALNRGDFETAKEYFQRVVDVDPDSAEGAEAKATLAALP